MGLEERLPIGGKFLLPLVLVDVLLLSERGCYLFFRSTVVKGSHEMEAHKFYYTVNLYQSRHGHL